MRKALLVAAFFFVAGTSSAGIIGEKVSYAAGKTKMKGYIARPVDIYGTLPAVLIVHEWWGHNAYVRERADMLAGLGYAALAVDMYGDGLQAEHPKEAGAFSKAVFENFGEGQARFNAALDFLRKQPYVDKENVAAIGYCFGGAVVLNMARAGADLRGVASFHGSLFAVKPAAPGRVKAKILVCTGGDDMMAPAAQVASFKKEMDAAGADYDVISYPGAKHGFTNPEADAKAKEFNLPMGYNARADKMSWKALRKFLKTVFKDHDYSRREYNPAGTRY